jgi:hypothetical protein
MAKPKSRPPARTASEITAAYQDGLKERGGGRFPTLTMTPEEMARWRALEARVGGDDRGSAKRTLLACMEALEARREPTNEQLLALLRTRLAPTIPTARMNQVGGE